MTSPFISKKQLKIGLAFLLSFAGVMLSVILLGGMRDVGYRFLWWAAFILIGIANTQYLFEVRLRKKRMFAIPAFLFVAAQAIGYRLQTAGHTGLSGILLCVGIGICFTPAMAYACIRFADVLDRRLTAEDPKRPRSLTKVFWGSFAIVFICWVPVFLAYYPGLFAYDVNQQISEIITGQLTNYNPLLHTLYLGGFYMLGGALGDYNMGIALAVLVQMTALAAAFAWLIRYMAMLRIPRVLGIAVLVAFALLPVHSILAISCTKDTLFTAAMLLYAIRLHQLSQDVDLLARRKWMLGTVVLIAAICLLRNNAFFGIALSIPLAFLIVPRPKRLRLLAMVLGGLLVYGMVGQGLRAFTQADGINRTELVSIPSQQMARVYALYHDVFPPSEEIIAYLPTAPNYYPYTADGVKTFAQVRKPGQMWGFIKLWGKVGLQYPVAYLDAHLLTMQGYWWLDDTTHARIYGEGLEDRQGYLLTDTKQGFGVTHTSYFPPLERLLERLFSANEYQRIPILSLLFAPSLYLWLTLFSLFRAIEQSNRVAIVISGFLLCYMLPMWFGACVLIRYVYPIMVCLPLHLFSPLERCIIE